MTGFRLSRRTRCFLLWTARVALVVYLVQILAIDHWQAHPADIFGIDGTSAHVAHCHGAGDCSDGGGPAITTLSEVAQMPLPPSLLPVTVVRDSAVPHDPFEDVPGQPPQAA